MMLLEGHSRALRQLKKKRLNLKIEIDQELKEKANCPDCGKELTLHGLKYTHKRYCKANQPEPLGLERLVPNPKSEL